MCILPSLLHSSISRAFPIAVLLGFLLIFGCLQKQEDKVDIKLSYMLIERENNITEGLLNDSISFPRHSVYFHIRANITSRENITHYLQVVDQTQDPYIVRLPLYSHETINGISRRWEGITGIQNGTELLVPLEPRVEKPLEQPVFFFNQVVGPGIPAQNELTITLVNASGHSLGTRKIKITITE